MEHSGRIGIYSLNTFTLRTALGINTVAVHALLHTVKNPRTNKTRYPAGRTGPGNRHSSQRNQRRR